MNNLPDKPGLTLQGAKEWIQTELNKGPNLLLLRLIFLTTMFILVVIWLPNSSIEINIKLNDIGPRESRETIETPLMANAEEMSLLPVRVETHVSAHSILDEKQSAEKKSPAKKKREKQAKRERTKSKRTPDWVTKLPKSAMSEQQLFILKYYQVAQQEQAKFGIPASIKLAQAIVETNAGKSRLYKKANNAFGIKGVGPAGFIRADDDAPRERFRKYKSVWQSFRDHSHFLQQPRYARLYRNKNYRDWAKGLKQCGYATSRTYAKALIRTVEYYELDKFD
jgi:flagellum-specific peptidoglycan hydrolase FlgJ